MRIQFHSLISKEFSPNIGIAYLHHYRTIALGLLFFSITVCWAKELKINPLMDNSTNSDN
jgi:hypothetical protein